MYAIRSYYALCIAFAGAHRKGHAARKAKTTRAAKATRSLTLTAEHVRSFAELSGDYVITSYSIHYTKLYDSTTAGIFRAPRSRNAGSPAAPACWSRAITVRSICI